MAERTFTLADLEAKVREIDGQIEAIRRDVEARMAELQRRKDAIQTTVALLTGEPESDVTTVAESPRDSGQLFYTPAPLNGWAEKLRGKKQMEALEIIAREKGGTLRVTEARDILIHAGLIKGSPRNATGHLYHLLRDWERFEKVEPGVFRLIEATEAFEDAVV